MPAHELRAGAVKVRSTAERGGGATRRGLDGAEHSARVEHVVAGQHAPTMGVAVGWQLRGQKVAQITRVRGTCTMRETQIDPEVNGDGDAPPHSSSLTAHTPVRHRHVTTSDTDRQAVT
jgi:hypothetical protein